MGLNGGLRNQHSEAVSFCIDCDTQEEIDFYWEKLLQNGGKEKACGWLSDQFGVCWQIIPKVLYQLISNPETAQKAVTSFQKMIKFDIETLVKESQ